MQHGGGCRAPPVTWSCRGPKGSSFFKDAALCRMPGRPCLGAPSVRNETLAGWLPRLWRFRGRLEIAGFVALRCARQTQPNPGGSRRSTRRSRVCPEGFRSVGVPLRRAAAIADASARNRKNLALLRQAGQGTSPRATKSVGAPRSGLP